MDVDRGPVFNPNATVVHGATVLRYTVTEWIKLISVPDSASELGIPQNLVLVTITDNFKVIISELSPVPDASNRRDTARRRKAERSEILTNSPYKTILEMKVAEKQKVDSVKRGKRLLSGRDVSKRSKKRNSWTRKAASCPGTDNVFPMPSITRRRLDPVPEMGNGTRCLCCNAKCFGSIHL
ncbi:hypothetical protein CBL_11573 [Carabus blaptoides fortunei]